MGRIDGYQVTYEIPGASPPCQASPFDYSRINLRGEVFNLKSFLSQNGQVTVR